MELKLRRVGSESFELAQEILDDAPSYSMNVDGVQKISDGGNSLFEALPSNIGYSDKHVLIVEMNNYAIGIIDFINGYPEPGTGFLGLLLLR